jgi:hypothetical protein
MAGTMVTYCKEPGIPDAIGYYTTDVVEEFVKNEISIRSKQKRLTPLHAVSGLALTLFAEYVKAKINDNIYPHFQPLRSLNSEPQTVNVTPQKEKD